MTTPYNPINIEEKNLVHEDLQEIKKLLIQQNLIQDQLMTTTEISQKYKINTQSVNKILKKAGVPRLTKERRCLESTFKKIFMGEQGAD